MKVGITGANGHLGNVICRILIERGYDVKALYKSDKRALFNLKLELVQGNVLNYEEVKNFVSGCDVVINAAAIISVHGDRTGIVHKTNTEGPKNIVEACITKGVKRLIHISSAHAVTELPLETPFDETRPYKQKGSFAYDFSKATGEQLVLKYVQEGRIDALIIRPSAIVGLYDYLPSMVGKSLLDFYNQKIPLLPPGGYNFIDVRDVASSIVNSIDKGKTGEIYLLSGEYYSFKHLAEISRKVTGKKIPERIVPFWFLQLLLPFFKIHSQLTGAAPMMTNEGLMALKLGHPNMVSTKAKNELGHSYRSLEESIRDFYEWNKERNVIV